MSLMIDEKRMRRSHCTVKKIRISTDISWRVFHILTEPVSYTFASVSQRNNEARAVKTWKTCHKKISVDIQIFFYSVQYNRHLSLIHI